MYIKKLLNNNNWLISLIYIPILYVLGWALISLIILIFPFLKNEKSLYGALISLFLFCCSLPIWSKLRWKSSLLNKVGSLNFQNNLNRKIFLEFLRSLLILLVIVILLLVGGYSRISLDFNILYLLNSIFLIIIVGFGEELIFRLWLFEELSLIFNMRIANFLQSIIFATLHLRSDLNNFSNLQIFIGMFLLAIYLNNWRNVRNSSILIPISFHGGLVGLWFLINNSFLDIKDNVPPILFGPGEGASLNPVGGLIGIIILIILIINQTTALTGTLSLKGRTESDSSKEDLP